jgi:hypothetical protein
MTAKLWRHCKVVCRRLLIFDRFDRRKEKVSHRRFSNLCCRRVLVSVSYTLFRERDLRNLA